MKKLVLPTLLLGLLAGPASAACYADYKAKRDGPLRLHYGVIALPDSVCSDRAAMRAYIENRIRNDNWELLNVLSVFGEDGLDGKKQDAGEFYLRY